jgi:ribosomal protein L21E
MGVESMKFNKGDRVIISIPKDWYFYQEYNNETGVVVDTDEVSDQVWVKLDNVFQDWGDRYIQW